MKIGGVKHIHLFFILLCFFFIHCETNHQNSCNVPTQAHGFGYSPLGFPNTYNQSVAFFEDVERLKDGAVMWNGSWRDDALDGSDAGVIPKGASAIQDASIQYCFVPLHVFGWRSGTTNLIQIPSATVNDWTNSQARAKYISMLVNFVNKYRPKYIFLGNENDFYYESNLPDYANWIIAYNTAYDAIKEVSEDTLIGPVFNFEHLTGQGLLNGWNTSYWEALEAHDLNRVDIVGLSVYPFFNYEDPADVPSNYLAPVFAKIGDRPLIITETGWPAQNLGSLNPQWTTTEEAQIEYVTRLSTFTSGRNIPVMNWLFFNGLEDDGSQSEAWKIFGSISIKNSQGNEYQVYNSWIDL
jgi:hypothetical protein